MVDSVQVIVSLGAVKLAINLKIWLMYKWFSVSIGVLVAYTLGHCLVVVGIQSITLISTCDIFYIYLSKLRTKVHDLKRCTTQLINFPVQMEKNKFQRKQHCCGPTGEQSTEDSSTTYCGVQTDSIVTTSVGTQTGPTSDEANVDHNLMTPTAGYCIIQISIKYFFLQTICCLGPATSTIRFEMHWKLVSHIRHPS